MRRYLLLLFSLLLSSCGSKDHPIEYGTDSCEYCKMTIMDHRYGSELVTDKGKVYKFDAVECLINYMKSNNNSPENYSRVLVTGYENPDQLIDAKSSWYLISEIIPSPMGANLTAFKDKESAIAKRADNTGEIYSWEELLIRFKAVN